VRGAGFGMAHDDYTQGAPVEKIAAANRRTLVIAQIETPRGAEAVDEIAAIEGRHARNRKLDALRELFTRASAFEAKYIAKILIGEMRHGVSEGLMLEAIAKIAREARSGRIDLAPLHNPDNIKGILAARKLFGKDVPQVAVFDTSFHHSLPEQAYLYALPYHLYQRYRIRRYGFHGTSHRYVAFRYRALRGLTREQTNIITLHLGNGCSAAAIKAGTSVDTSMGMTPLEGLVMGTRSGDLDPAVVNVIGQKEGLSPSEVDTLLNTQSGLLGVSGLTNDMRKLQAQLKEHDDPRARLAIEIFCYRARKYIGAFLAAMGGADAVVFTGGIGENSPDIRTRISSGLEWAGLHLDAERNEQIVGREDKISTDDSKLLAYTIPTDEELLIARDTVRVIQGEPHPS